MEYSIEDIAVAAEAMADNNRFGSVPTTDGTARSAQFMESLPSSFATNNIAPSDPHSSGWGMIISRNHQLQHQHQGRINNHSNNNNHNNHNHGNTQNNNHTHGHNHNHNHNHNDGDIITGNISSILDILNDPGNQRRQNERNAVLSENRSLMESANAAFDTDSLWRMRPDGQEGDDDDISVDISVERLSRGRLRIRPSSAAPGNVLADDHDHGPLSLSHNRNHSGNLNVNGNGNVSELSETSNHDNNLNNNHATERDSKPPESICVTTNATTASNAPTATTTTTTTNNTNNNSNNNNSASSNGHNLFHSTHRMTRSSTRRQWNQQPTRIAPGNALSTVLFDNNASTAPTARQSNGFRTRRTTRAGTTTDPSNTNTNSDTTTQPQPQQPLRTRPNTRSHCKRSLSEISTPSASNVPRKKSTKRLARVKTEETSSASSKSSKEMEENLKSADVDISKKCCICLEVPKPNELAKIDSCSHPYCFSCIEQWAARENTCPLCKSRFKEIKRVHKVKSVKKKGKGAKTGGEGCATNVKKVKDRDQKSDYRQQHPLQAIFAHMEAHIEAHGLNVLFAGASNPFFHHESVPNFIQHNNSAPVTRSQGPFAALAGLGGPPNPRLSSLLQGSMSPSAQQQAQGSPPTGSTNGNADSYSSVLRRNRLVRRGTSRPGTSGPGSSRNDTSSLLRPMIGRNIDISFAVPGNTAIGRRSPPPLTSRRFSANEAIAASRDRTVGSATNSAFDFDFLDPSNPFLEPGFHPSPRSFAANGHQQGAGFSAATPLEILDDSDDDDNEVQVY